MEKLGQILLKMGAIDEKQLSMALAQCQKSGEIFGKVILEMGYVTEEQLLLALSKQFDITYYPSLKDVEVPESVIKAIPVRFVWHYKFMPLAIKDDVLKLAISDPLEIWSTEDIKLLLGYNVEIVLAPSSEILEAIRVYYGVGAETGQRILEEKEPAKEEGIETKADDIEKTAGGASVIKLVEQILMSAIKSQATDIHLESYKDKIKIRCRVDGILYDLALPPDVKSLYPAIISRIKIISGLDVVERRMSQNGRVKIKFHGSEIDLRVSVIPVTNGENIVIRILPGEMAYKIAELGFLKDDLERIKTIIHFPIGLIFLAGPAGSGKTTTLYACLSEIKSSDTKIITIEDPIEYEMEDIMQVQIAPKRGVTFANSLRSILRHDPDIIMIGEVRDMETAELAVRSALTGHLIFSTIHTNDATSGIARLMDMGVEPFLLVSAAKAFIAQRLVRVICDKCKIAHDIEGVAAQQNIPVKKHYKGKGCDACRYTGYKGRTAIYEVFIMDNEIQDMVLKGASSQEVRQKAIEKGMKTLRQNGWMKVEDGITTIEEVLRVTDAD